jgi:hypothetical protein
MTCKAALSPRDSIGRVGAFRQPRTPARQRQVAIRQLDMDQFHRTPYDEATY